MLISYASPFGSSLFFRLCYKRYTGIKLVVKSIKAVRNTSFQKPPQVSKRRRFLTTVGMAIVDILFCLQLTPGVDELIILPTQQTWQTIVQAFQSG
ncbi:hypothetical protein OUZ56_001689 [Daphnia magna]|uniref:Uncharacterized protein n=1 Tax=Daphnia magna TaxID=35525 RepID=A0ABR0A3F2_9CRUS|nr:hypothetical protein OUZ56_001689 [Daphnia magna]